MASIIIKNCNQCELDIPLKYAQKLYQQFAIRHPNAFYLQTRVRGMRNWDGKVKYITERGLFKIGLLPSVIRALDEMGLKNVKVIDERLPVPVVKKPITEIGRFKLRPEQVAAVNSILHNKINNNPFHIGVLDYTVNAGKCTGKGTLIRTNKGLLPIENIVNEEGKIISNCKVLTKEGEYIKPSAGVFNRIKAIRVTTNWGYELICGYNNHRLFTVDEMGRLSWVYAHDLKPGDSIPLYMGQTGKQSNNINPDLAYALGCIQGDGHVLKKTNRLIISISGQDYEVAEAYKLALDKVCKTPLRIKPHRKFKGFHISKSDTNLTKLITEDFPELIGLSYHKIIPQNILEASTEVQCYYIAGLYDTDGNVSTSNRTISFSSVCEANTKRLQNLLLSLGIPSCRRVKKTLCNGKEGITYRITIHSEYYDRFFEIIPLKIPRKCHQAFAKRNNYQPKLPFRIGRVISEEYRGQDWRTRGIFKERFGRTLTQQVLKPERATLESLRVMSYEAFGENLRCKKLYNFCKDVAWDVIEEVEVLDDYPCYDMEIPKYHNYISNGFISHNTLIMAATYLSFKRRLKTLLITNDADWLRQSQEEFKEYLPGEDITFIQGRSKKPWTQFNIGMVQSLSRNMKFYQNEMAKVDMVFVDEADQAGSKQYSNVLSHLYNTRVRIGLSGTIYMSKLAKDKVKNMNLRSFFGDVIAKFTLKESIKKGYSTNVVVKMIECQKFLRAYDPECICGNNYKEIYDRCITKGQFSYVPIVDRVLRAVKWDRLPLLIVTKYVKHCEIIKDILKQALDKSLNIACVHVNTKDKERKKIMQDFRTGKIDILVSTTIIARGKNFPLLKAMINAGSMKAQEKTIQFLGRLVRTHDSKTKTYLDDIHYPGKYLDNHGRSRRRYYKEQGLKVIRINYKPPRKND